MFISRFVYRSLFGSIVDLTSPQSDYDVCPICGATDICPHDETTGTSNIGSSRSADLASLDSDNLEMSVASPIPPQTEVYNTYGAHLSNAQLLAQYGFLLDSNENDRVPLHPLSPYDIPSIMSICSRLATVPGLDSSSLIETATEDRASEGGVFYVNSEGKVSLALWIYCALSHVWATDFDLEGLLRAHIVAEDTDSKAKISAGVLRIAKTILSLVRARKADLCAGKGFTSAADLGEALDALPASRPRTHLAIMHLMGEWSLLEACEAGWAEFCDPEASSDG